eukprot:CAMPEP_0197834994 /NCGR_PEP_ID=MMETSP1437-20131217/24396_1 /TAXON_ID=49252 ORGANISM="Eucampia antarctica, Strain CCMP1452" /NCGR_SAMPLE_ID=MMETSP1437 /ASSEMBLY_ACC=CAM_ASM_001096 /LENGTH=525 /DNA_ID=CAMNT_0043440095 /DNA_START=34 /DNA_END=1611 /DNA_ORIENTATION=+
MTDETPSKHHKTKEEIRNSRKKKKKKRGRDSLSSTGKIDKKIKSEEKVPKKEGVNANPIAISDSKEGVETVTVNVKKCAPEYDPIVVSFPSGTPSALVGGTQQRNDTNNDDNGKTVSFAQDDDNDAQNGVPPTFTWMKLKKSSSRGKTVNGEDRTCSYTASNGGRSNMDSRLTKFYIGIYDKETKSLVLQPSAEKGTVYALCQKVKDYDSSPLLASGATSGMTVAERKRFLVESFGSSRKKKAVKSQQANIVNISNVVGSGDVMMNAMEKQTNISQSNKKAMDAARRGEQEDLVEIAYNEARRKFLPSFNEDATACFDVYDAREIAGGDAWDQLSRITDACVMKPKNHEFWLDSLMGRHQWVKSTKNVLNSVVGSPRSASNRYQIKTIQLLNFLIAFHNKCFKLFLAGTEEQIAKSAGIPSTICSRFLTMFAVPSEERGREGFSITKQLKDKRTIHLLILYLLAHGKLMKVGSINTLCQDIKLEVTEAARLLVQAGCKCKKSTTGMISTSLTVPLTFPKPKLLKK